MTHVPHQWHVICVNVNRDDCINVQVYTCVSVYIVWVHYGCCITRSPHCQVIVMVVVGCAGTSRGYNM